MATTYTATKAGSTVVSRHSIDSTWVWETYEAGTQLIINDVVQMVKVPLGATVLDVVLCVDDIDSGSAAVLAVGDGTTPTRFISGQTIGQGGGIARLGAGLTGSAAADCAFYQYTAEDTIDIKVTTAPAGSGVGTLKLGVCYSMNG